jgi:hypothetical protein
MGAGYLSEGVQMNIGMLWFDNDTKTELSTKIERAATYYREKYGNKPNVCFIHPSMLKSEAADTANKTVIRGEIELRTSKSVLPNHFWIGINGTLSPSSL